MKKVIGYALTSATVGALFGLVMATSIPDPHAAVSGVAAAAFMYGSLAYFGGVESREEKAARDAETEG